MQILSSASTFEIEIDGTAAEKTCKVVDTVSHVVRQVEEEKSRKRKLRLETKVFMKTLLLHGVGLGVERMVC